LKDGSEHSSVSTTTNIKLNIAINIAETYLLSVKLGSVFAPQASELLVPFLNCASVILERSFHLVC
jgi:hypothetical protein